MELNKEVKLRAGLSADSEITIEDMKKVTEVNCHAQDLTGLEYATELTSINTNGTEKVKGKVTFPSSMVGFTKLNTFKMNTSGLNNEDIVNLANSTSTNITYLDVRSNHITDVSTLGLKKFSNKNFLLSNQNVTENQRKILVGRDLIVKVKAIKDIDGTTPDIVPDNGGEYDSKKGIIIWSDIKKDISKVSYNWKGSGTFTGKVTIPVEILTKSIAKKVPVIETNKINELYKDNKYNELASTTTLEQIINLQVAMNDYNFYSDYSELENLIFRAFGLFEEPIGSVEHLTGEIKNLFVDETCSSLKSFVTIDDVTRIYKKVLRIYDEKDRENLTTLLSKVLELL